MPPLLSISSVSKRFGETVVLDRVSLALAEGEVLVLLGPSGSGKTTLLRLIAGFETPDAGVIELAGDDIGRLPPAKRNFGMVFQHYALFPHLSVERNVAFGLEMRKAPAREVRRRVAEALAQVDLAGFEGRRVHELSGGQQQRVALARALAPDPRILLLDEPLSNLDPALRERTRREIRAAIERVGITAVWVTHEQEEAFDVGDRVAVLNRGRLEQVGAPEALYLEPATRFVARFVGRASFLRGVLTDDRKVLIGDERFVGCGVRWPAVAGPELAPGAEVELMLRPEALRVLAPGAPAGESGTLPGVLGERRYAGERTYYRVELDQVGLALATGPIDAGEPGDRVAVGLAPDAPPGRAFAAESPETAPPDSLGTAS